jgi:hypothetical protein
VQSPSLRQVSVTETGAGHAAATIAVAPKATTRKPLLEPNILRTDPPRKDSFSRGENPPPTLSADVR